MKNLIYLSVLLSVWSLKLNAQDIDFPLLQSEIEKYESRVHIQRLPNVYVTHPDAYKIRTQQPVYPSSTKRITLDVINVDAPTAEPELHWMKYRKGGEWKEFPFIDNLAFAGVGRDLSKGDTLPEHIHMSEFKYPLKPNKYQVHFYVFSNIYTYCNLTDMGIQPVKGTEMQGAFSFRVLESDNDSIRIQFENHTNLSVQPLFLPSIGTDELYMVHPLTRSGSRDESDYMRSCARLEAGEAMLFSIPVSWNVSRITDPNYKKRFSSGRLSPGKYKIGLSLEIYMNTEFEVK